MAFSNQIMALALVLSLVVALIPSALAEVICENLPINQCAFAVSLTNKRCVIESMQQRGGTTSQCKTSDVQIPPNFFISNHIETEACVRTCGLESNTIGIMSHKSLMDSRILKKFCSKSCMNNCKNLTKIVLQNNEPPIFTPC